MQRYQAAGTLHRGFPESARRGWYVVIGRVGRARRKTADLEVYVLVKALMPMARRRRWVRCRALCQTPC